MRLIPLGGMDALRAIGFGDALAWLQGMLGREVRIVVEHRGRFLGCGFEGALCRVETLPPDDVAIRVVVGRGEGLFLDPEDMRCFLVGGGEEEWLELHSGFGVIVTVEPAESAR